MDENHDAARDKYLVFVDQDQDEDTELNLDLDIGVGREGFRAETDVRVDVSNTTSRLGVAGFIVSVLGFLVGLTGLILFIVYYPEEWFPIDNKVIHYLVSSFTIGGFTLAFAGFLLVAYGRRILARGRIESLELRTQ